MPKREKIKASKKLKKRFWPSTFYNYSGKLCPKSPLQNHWYLLGRKTCQDSNLGSNYAVKKPVRNEKGKSTGEECTEKIKPTGSNLQRWGSRQWSAHLPATC